MIFGLNADRGTRTLTKILESFKERSFRAVSYKV